jgi:tRNA A-37 threonylcarbamoyl transferase component Bud32
MSQEPVCPECGAPLPAGSPEGHCPRCLLKRGLEPNTLDGTTGQSSQSARWTPPKLEELAGRFPELEILELIGRGGMGAVYKARQKNLDRTVALKILPPEIGRDPAFAERFAREAQALARLSHPHIVAIHDFGERQGLYFFLMEYVDGLNLRQLMSSGHIEAKEALAIVPQICEALQFAHDQGIVHRDIKPENILLDRRGQVKIADFGLAKLMGQPASASAATAEKVMGTPQYMAPEQVEHPKDVDHRADIYSLGVVFYQMLTGELPLGRFEPPSRKVLIDVRLDEVVLRALEKEPDRRYQQASQVRTEVETIIGSAQVTGVAAVAPAGINPQIFGWEYRSKRTLFGLPLLHVAMGLDPATGKARKAVGIIAVGAQARGVVAMGGFAQGFLAFGGFAIGVIAIGGVSLGLAAFGGVAVALLLAYGGVAVAPWAMGGLAIGYYSMGGLAWGIRAFGADTPWSSDLAGFRRETMAAVSVFFYVLFGAMISLYGGLVLFGRRQAKRKPNGSPTSGGPPATATSSRKRHRLRNAVLTVVIAVAISLVTRTFVLQEFWIANDAVSPAIPQGSRAFVYKLARTFEPGDIVVYRHEGGAWSGRVAQPGPKDGVLLIERRSQSPQPVPMSDVVGRVILNTRSQMADGQNAAAPHVVRTSPATMANDVDPALHRITATFDRPMMDQSWSWTMYGKGETFPPKTGEPSYEAARTMCTLPVKLEPGKVYWVGVNGPGNVYFQTADHVPAPPYAILFATKAADGQPTPLPEDMVRKTREINSAAGPAASKAATDRPAQLKAWVEDFFQHNYRDITARETVEWGQPETDSSGNLSIRYKYKATIWGKDKLVIEDLFTFTPEGKFVAVKKLSKSGPAQPSATAPVQRRQVNRLVKDFPEAADLSTPESACAAWNRAGGRMDAQAVAALCWNKVAPGELEKFWKSDPKDMAVYNQAQLDAEIIEVLTYKDDLAEVITKLKFPEGVGRDPFSLRSFGRINGQWKNLGEDRCPSVEAARERFEQSREVGWKAFQTLKEQIVGHATPVAAAAAPPVPVGKVVELTIYDVRTGKASLADLETGTVILPDVTKVRGDDPAGRAWFKDHGIDLVAYARTDTGDAAVGGYDMSAVKMDNGQFDTAKLKDVEQTLHNAPPQVGVIMSVKGGLPVTYALRTREGSVVVLQIVAAELAQAPAYFKLRYKILARSPAEGGAKPGAK